METTDLRNRDSQGRYSTGANAVNTIPVEGRFWAKVDRKGPDDCWIWRASLMDGYGRLKINGRHVRASRFAYELLVGPIPEGLEPDHLCRNRACVNPAHIEPVTHQINDLRGVGVGALNARKAHCPQGHPYDLLNTYISPSGGRFCRVCQRTRKLSR